MVEAPAVAVIFVSSLAVEVDADYEAMSAEMDALAEMQDGFLGMHSVRDAATARGITVSYWRDESSAHAWKHVAAHQEAQRLGRERWYSQYEVVVADVRRSHVHGIESASAGAD